MSVINMNSTFLLMTASSSDMWIAWLGMLHYVNSKSMLTIHSFARMLNTFHRNPVCSLEPRS